MVGIPNDVVLANLTTPPVKGVVSPFVATEPAFRDGSRLVPNQAQLLFAEDFSQQANWVPSVALADYQYPPNIPPNFESCRSAEAKFAPSTGYPTKHETIEITDELMFGTAKVLRLWRDSDDQQNANLWHSDGQLSKHFPDNGGLDEVYVEFWLRFQPGWTAINHGIKMFRISSWDHVGPIYQGFSGGANGPILIWNANHSAYGARNGLYLRCGPWGDNYYFDYPTDIPDFPRESMNWATDLRLDLPNQDGNGGLLSDIPGAVLSHENVYGPSLWNKLGFYVKMNSDYGVKDGKLYQWFNDQLILKLDAVPWYKPSTQARPKWNVVSFGGNDYFPQYPAADAHEEWSAITKIKIYDGIPEGLI